MDFILNRIKYKTRRRIKCFHAIILSTSLIVGLLSIKSKPMYKVSISGTELGYVPNKQALEEKVKNSILEEEEKNVDNIVIKEEPAYVLTFVDTKDIAKNKEIVEDKVVEAVKQEATITYKYYELALDNQPIDAVDTIEEAEELVSHMKEEKNEDLDLSIVEKYTEKKEEVNTTDLEVAKNEMQGKITEKMEQIKIQKAEEERINSMPEINGIKLAYVPITGTITSRYGVSSRIRSSNHTGLDIATASGTPIKVVASGTVTYADYKGSYGNVVKVDHGNGLETWYAHTSKMYVSEGQQVQAGDVIAAVGSTGNSTGPHLHLEVRVNGQHVNPQNYLYH